MTGAKWDLVSRLSTVLHQQLNGIKGGINVLDTKLASKTSIKQNTMRQCII